MRREVVAVMVAALGVACGENANEIGIEHAVPGVGGTAGSEGDSAEGGSMSGSAGASATAGGPSGSGGASTGAGGAGLGGAASGSGGASPATGGAEASTGGSAGSAPTSCDDGTDWDLDWQQFECDLIALINERRTAGYDCGIGDIPPVSQTERNQLLTDVAREHAQYMVESDSGCFNPSCPPERDYPEWVYAGGFTGTMEYELVGGWADTADAEGLRDLIISPDATPGSILPSICQGMMDADADKIAIGFYEDTWVILLASGGD
jgi:hypothetical protein